VYVVGLDSRKITRVGDNKLGVIAVGNLFDGWIKCGGRVVTGKRQMIFDVGKSCCTHNVHCS
jgi:hypothetical protein